MDNCLQNLSHFHHVQLLKVSHKSEPLEPHDHKDAKRYLPWPNAVSSLLIEVQTWGMMTEGGEGRRGGQRRKEEEGEGGREGNMWKRDDGGRRREESVGGGGKRRMRT